jgi:excinuclease ABC subunit B
MYADVVTRSMHQAIAETNRRRELQLKYNQDHGITPETIHKQIDSSLITAEEADYYTVSILDDPELAGVRSIQQIHELIEQNEKEMLESAKNLEFEKAAQLRDKIKKLKDREMTLLQ